MRYAMALTLLLGAGCFQRASIPEPERQLASRELEGRRYFTKVAVFVGPFFEDRSKLLVSDQPFGELDLVETVSGDVVSPPPAERVLPPGTPLRLDKVEFPTGWLVANRVVATPRNKPWAYFTLEGEARPLVLVLPATTASAADVRLEIERVVGTTDPGPALRALPEPQQAAVARKELVKGMSPQAAEMAWGYPERKKVDRPAGVEDWTWPGRRRVASFREGELVWWRARP